MPPRLYKNRYRSYDYQALKPFIDQMRQPYFNSHDLSMFAKNQGIPIKTAQRWRRNALKSPTWYPDYSRNKFNRQALCPLSEDIISTDIDALNERGVVVGKLHLHSFGMQQFQFQPRQIKNYKAGRKWMRNFCTRNDFNYKSSRNISRPGMLNQEQVQVFKAQMRNVVANYPPENIINMDETSFQLLKDQNRAYARVGSDQVNGFSGTDLKLCFTAIGGITMSGEKFPFWLIAQGTTNACHQQFGFYADSEECIVTHSPSGWMNENIMVEYLEWLANQYDSIPIALIVDCYGSHVTEKVMNKARDLSIEMVVVPAGGTGLYQPLDIAVYGMLKPIAASTFREMYFYYSDMIVINKTLAAMCLIESWKKMIQEQIKLGWKQYIEMHDQMENPMNINYYLNY